MMDCDTTGVEPDLALVKFKKLVGGGSMQIVNQSVPRSLRALGYPEEQVEAIVEHIAEHGHVVDAPGLKPEHYAVFDCAMGERSIAPMGHVRMMAAVQPFISGAISKTVNMPESATVEEIEGIYFEAWRLGIKALAVLSTGEPVPNPRHLNKALTALRTASRTLSRRVGPDRRTGQRPSARWETARRDLTRIHTRVANLRQDAIHKLTTDLATTYGTVVVEDLNVSGMLKNHKLARHIADASFGEIRRQLDYKTGWNDGRLAVADRWFPSSKTCSGCGTVKPKLGLADRVFTCDACGLVIDRDLNAALNLKQYVDLEWPGDAKTGRGADQKTKPSLAGGCETPTPHHLGGQDGDRRPVTAGCEQWTH